MGQRKKNNKNNKKNQKRKQTFLQLYDLLLQLGHLVLRCKSKRRSIS